jgi:peroxiredoxin
LRDAYPQITGKGAEVIAVGTGDARYASAFVSEESIPYPVLVDDDAAAANAAAVKASSFLGLFHPRTFAATRETRRRGFRIHKAGKRVTQLGATFVIRPDEGGGAHVAYAHLDRDSTDHAPIAEVLAALP